MSNCRSMSAGRVTVDIFSAMYMIAICIRVADSMNLIVILKS